MFKLDLEKAEEPEIKLLTSIGLLKKQENSRKTFNCVYHNKLWKVLKEMEIPDHLTCLLRNLYAGHGATVRIGHEQQTDSKLGQEYIKALYTVTLVI